MFDYFQNTYYDKGIYGIYINDTLMYIGQTRVSFLERFNRHSEKMAANQWRSQAKLYETMRQALLNGDSVYMAPILALEDLTMSDKALITQRDLDIMEMTAIALMRPKLNTLGLVTNYKFSDNGSSFVFHCSRYEEGYEKPLLQSNWRLEFKLMSDDDCLNFN